MPFSFTFTEAPAEVFPPEERPQAFLSDPRPTYPELQVGDIIRPVHDTSDEGDGVVSQIWMRDERKSWLRIFGTKFLDSATCSCHDFLDRACDGVDHEQSNRKMK